MYKVGDVLISKIATDKNLIYIKILYVNLISEIETIGFEFIRRKEFKRAIVDIDFAPIKDVSKYYRHATEQELMELTIKEII